MYAFFYLFEIHYSLIKFRHPCYNSCTHNVQWCRENSCIYQHTENGALKSHNYRLDTQVKDLPPSSCRV